MLKSLINNILLLTPSIINLMMIIMMMNPLKNKFHPLSLMIILIFMTFLISIKMNLLFISLMPFILFLAMIGGLMIIFLYISSLSNNEFFYININMFILNIIKILPLILFMIMYYYNLPMNYFMNFNIQDSLKINTSQFIIDQLNMNILYNKINNKSTMFIMLYIYYSMICIMNICYKLKLPLRQLMY